MSRRRTLHRAAPAVGVLSEGARRRRRSRRAPILLALGLLLPLLILALVTSANSSNGPSQAGASRVPPKPGKPTPTVLRKGGSLSPAVRRHSRESLAIDKVLRYTPFISAGTPRHRVIALTFDDGPSPYTRPIVRQLTRMHVPATFFVVGQQLNDFSAGLGDEIANGFEIGDHTENHAMLSRLTPRNQFGQINDAGLRVRHLGAPYPRLFRPPYGAYNRATLQSLRRLKMLMVLWSIDPSDWRRPGTPAIVSNVLANARPGAIVILHDGGGDRSQTLAALPAIVNGLRRRHYAFVTVPQMLLLDPPPRHQQLPHIGAA